MTTGFLMTAWMTAALSIAPAAGWPSASRYDSAINMRDFHIPISVDPNRRQQIKDLILCVSADLGRTWKEVGIANPNQQAFAFQAPADGVYWLNLVIVDGAGRRDPPDVRRAAPAMRVLVDTVRPTIRVHSAERQGEEVSVSWDIQDDNLDLATLKMEYRTADMPANQWNPTTINQASSGQVRFRLTSTAAVSIRILAQDQARNQGVATAEIAGSGGSLQSNNAPPAAPPARSTWDTGPVRSTTAYRDPGAEAAFAPPVNTQSFAPSSGNDAGGRLVASSEFSPGAGFNGVNGRPRGMLPPLQIVNNPQVSLDYEVSKVGPSGVAKVELWLTQDDGRSWRRYAEDTTRLKPPITVQLPGEGVYGFCLVVQNRAGLGRRAPVSGDAPEIRIEVDQSSPVAQMFKPEADPKRPNCLLLSWSANDRNLAPNPITLQWAEKPNGTWETIGGGDLPNTGQYTWQLPPNLPYRVYLRLVTRDNAGNSCEAVTAEPVLVDLSEPEARLTGLTGPQRRP